MKNAFLHTLGRVIHRELHIIRKRPVYGLGSVGAMVLSMVFFLKN